MVFSNQPWYCNACGQKQEDSSPCNAMGRNYRCCSMDCVQEMHWRDALSILGKEYVERDRSKEK